MFSLKRLAYLSFVSLFLLLFLIQPLVLFAHQGPSCALSKTDELTSALLHKVSDGDTLRLGDGRKVRIIGINTPELASKTRSAEPYALMAKQAAEVFLEKSKQRYLLEGVEPKDPHSRVLAHVFNEEKDILAEYLLRHGLAMQIVIPPNTRFNECYRHAE